MSDLGNKRIMGDNIQYFLDKYGITRRDFAKAVGIPYSTLTEWMNARAYPRIDKIEIMANYFGVDKSELVEKRKPELDPTVRRLLSYVEKLTPEQAESLIPLIKSMTKEV